MSYPEPTQLRDQLWSPVQNSALWLGWWVHQVISTDLLLDAFRSVQGPVQLLDATSALAAGIASTEELSGTTAPLGDLLRLVRRVTDDVPVSADSRPLVGLVLAGHGDVPALPAGSAAAEAVQRCGAGITLADTDPNTIHVLVPEMKYSEFHESEAVFWQWFVAQGPVPHLPFYSPGEADEHLREAMDRAGELVANSGQSQLRRPDVRLEVGTLADAFGLPGLPPGVSLRASRLLARADYVSAIVETARTSDAGRSFDPMLLPLLRTIRAARMTAVDYAFRELVR
ncbi:hypothetical protein ACUY3M_08975 [Corynebacterium suicordis]